MLWYESKPFIQENNHGKMIGLEVEILESFRSFLKETRDIDLEINWLKPESFYGIIELVSNSDKPNLFGASAFSITEDRKKLVKYTSSYLPDITVLISSQGTPIVKSFDKVHEMMKDMTAITIHGTIYEGFLLDLRNKINADFEIKYITSDDNVLNHISQTPNSFGFMDLPIYLMWVKNGTSLVRQNFFTINGIGYGFIMPQTSDWDIPF